MHFFRSRNFATANSKLVSVFQIGHKINSLNYRADKSIAFQNQCKDQANKKTPTSLKREIDSLQQKNPNHILLVQVGMFYEIYGSYVDEIAALLGLRIGVHKGAEGSDHRYSRFAGFPTTSLRNHLEVLLQNGKTVAICDQIRPNPASDYVYRKVSRIVTPGTMIDESLDADNNFLLSIYSKTWTATSKIGLAYLDVSTGEFNLTFTSSKLLLNDLNRIQPKEILVPLSISSCSPSLLQSIRETFPSILLSFKPESYYTSDDVISKLSEMIITNDSSKAILNSKPQDVIRNLKKGQAEAAGGLLNYLSEIFPESKPSIRSPLEISSNVLQLDSCSLSALEIVKTQREGSRKGSLLSVLDKTKTAAGHRLLLSRLKAPSTNLNEINRRLDLIDIFYNDSFLTSNIAALLSECKDIERALQRIHLGTGAPSDLTSIIKTLGNSESIKEILLQKLNSMDNGSHKQALLELLNELGNFNEIVQNLNGLITDEATAQNKINSLGVIQSGVSLQLDEERIVYHKLLKKQEARAELLSGLFKLKCNLNVDSRLGPVVEIGKATEKTIERILQTIDDTPSLSLTLKRRTAISNSTKFKDEIWTHLHHEILEKTEFLMSLEAEIFSKACKDITNETLEIVNLCKSLAELDISCSQATLALNTGYARPKISETTNEHVIKGSRHPVVEHYQMARGNSFVINDIDLSAERLMLLTGPNMGGKSTYLRQTALISIMAQSGLFVPCTSANLSIVDKIFTRIGSSDDLSANQSTFMVEMKETATILKNATERSLIIMDEVGRGTSTNDGIALALAIIEHLVRVNSSKCIFATHYHELASLISNNQIKGVSFFKAACLIDGSNQITCLHKIVPGVMDQSHGIKIAKVAGLPQSVIEHATQFYKKL